MAAQPLARGPGDRHLWVVAGSNAGQARVPGWVFNISAYDRGWIDVNGEHWTVRFEPAVGADRDAMYDLMIAVWKAYASYARHSPRYIPVFPIHLLDRVSADTLPQTPQLPPSLDLTTISGAWEA